MRIWSIHPKYLDTKGLVALWREALLARHVLEGKTKGYRNHPQLDRFKKADKPVDAINQYLAAVFDEACVRGYHFDPGKINREFVPVSMQVTTGQIRYETLHLLGKLKQRDKERFMTLEKKLKLLPHPMFLIVSGKIEKWEVV
jgi:hypothetical protein